MPIEDSVGELKRAVEAGKIGAIGLSEMGAATIRRAHAVHPIAAVQSEYSAMVRNPEVAVLDTCREYARRNREQGFWGGENDETRTEIRRRAARMRPRIAG